MNIISYNTIGCGSLIKRKKLAHLIRKDDFDVCFLQETKVKVVDDILVYVVWGNKEVEWSYKDASERRGIYSSCGRNLSLTFSLVLWLKASLVSKWVGNEGFIILLMSIILTKFV